MKIAALAGVELRRFVRDRANIFFVFIFPLLLVLVIGLQFGGSASQGTLAVVGSHSELRTSIENGLDSVETVEVNSDEARQMVARQRADAAVIISHEAARHFDARHDVELTVIEGSSAGSPVTMQELRNAVTRAGVRNGQIQTLVDHDVEVDDARSASARADESTAEPRDQGTDD